MWEIIQRVQFNATPPAALKHFPNRAPTPERVNAEIYGLFKLRAVLRGEYLDSSATLSLEVRRFVEEMDEIDAGLRRDFAEEVREKARMMGKPVPMRTEGVLPAKW